MVVGVKKGEEGAFGDQHSSELQPEDMAMNFSELTGKQKAAILMITLGPDVFAKVFRHLREEEIEDLTLEIAAPQGRT